MFITDLIKISLKNSIMSRHDRRKTDADIPNISGYNNYEILGEGTYGKVYKAEIIERPSHTNDQVPTAFAHNNRKHNCEYVAIKKVKTDHEADGIPATAIREISLLRELDHDNIVRLRDVVSMREDAKSQLFLIFEYLDMDLKNFMKRYQGGKPMPLALAVSYSIQCLRGMEYCHSHRVLHRDIKPDNLLLNIRGEMKLADFGLARTFTIPIRMYTHEVVTLWYRPPEILLGSKNYSTSVDMWSIGCVMCELITNSAIFSGNCEIEQLFKIFEILGTPNEGCWEGIDELPHVNSEFPKWKKKPLANLLQESRKTAGITFKERQKKKIKKLQNQNSTQSQNSRDGNNVSSQLTLSQDNVDPNYEIEKIEKNMNQTDEFDLNKDPDFTMIYDELVDLIEKLLTYDPRIRISAKRALKSKKILTQMKYRPTAAFYQVFGLRKEEYPTKVADNSLDKENQNQSQIITKKVISEQTHVISKRVQQLRASNKQNAQNKMADKHNHTSSTQDSGYTTINDENQKMEKNNDQNSSGNMMQDGRIRKYSDQNSKNHANTNSAATQPTSKMARVTRGRK